MGYNYKIPQDFCDIISLFRTIIINHGIVLLEELSEIPPDEIVFKTEYYDLLRQRKEVISSTLRNSEKPLSDEQRLQAIIQSVEDLRGNPIEEAAEQLVDLSAIYGDWIISVFGGVWADRGLEYIVKDVGPEKDVVSPIWDVFSHWGEKYRISYGSLYKQHGEDNPMYLLLKKYNML